MEDRPDMLSNKTRFLNIFRRIFMAGFLEKALVKRSLGRPPTAFWPRVVPPNFLYPKNSERVAVRHGVKYRLDISDYVEHYIYFGFSDDSHEELFRLAKGKRTIIDVGVNIGSVIMNLSRHAPDAAIFGFEPDPKNFAKAAANISLNDFGNITLVKKGLGEKAAAVKLYRVNSANEGMNRILKNSEDAGGEEIAIITLDAFSEENKLGDMDLIKIDVEGYELNVLRGARHILQTRAPLLFIELDDENLKAQGDSAGALLRFLQDLGYRARRADNNASIDAGHELAGCHFDIVCEKITG
jgi:FkbM family methyltransferase